MLVNKSNHDSRVIQIKQYKIFKSENYYLNNLTMFKAEFIRYLKSLKNPKSIKLFNIDTEFHID